MPNGANSVHKQLRTELEDYIKSQYFGKSPLLLSALSDHIDDEGLLYQKPFIESSPAYVTVQNGIETASIEPWLKDYFLQLAEAGIGVFPSPFAHQISALEAATRGENLFVSTGTGSGKTECFMWPLLAKMADEARNSKESWAKRGVRTIVMYPMNALVSDQVSRLRRMIGDPDKKFIKTFKTPAVTKFAVPNLVCILVEPHTLERSLLQNRTENLKKLWPECLSRKVILNKNTSITFSKRERSPQRQICISFCKDFMRVGIFQTMRTQS